MTARTGASIPEPPRTPAYHVTLRPFCARAPVPADDVEVREGRAGGWWGRASFIPRLSTGRGLSRDRAKATTFDIALDSGLLPGKSVAIRLVIETGGGRTTRALARTWPSVITRVDAHADTGICDVFFRDPLTWRARRPIWGAYRDCSPGEMLGGAMSLAAGGDGRPTLTPVLPGMPLVRISQYLRAALERVPCAIAAGQALVPWLDGVLGRLGVRIEMLGYPQGQVAVALRDTAPSGTPVEMTLDSGEASAMNAAVVASRAYPGHPARATVPDDPGLSAAGRIGGPGAVEAVSCVAQIDLAESEPRAGFARQRTDLRRSRMLVETKRTGLMPGRLVKFTNRSAGGETLWQTGDATHLFSTGRLAAGRPCADTRGAYANRVVLESGRAPWRPPIPPEDGPVIVSGIVDDGACAEGAAVARDRLGRIPIRFCFLPAGGDPSQRGSGASGAGAGGGDDGSPGEAWPPRIPLPVVEPMAGGVHGFLAAHRGGDVCRILIRNPMYAEVLGFGRHDHQRISRDMTGISTGVIVRDGHDGRWSGIVFLPGQDREDAGGAAPEVEEVEEVEEVDADHRRAEAGSRPPPEGP